MVMHVDEALRMLGSYSRWQIITYVMLSIGCWFPFSWAMMAIVFIADVPGHTCSPPPNTTLNESIPGSYENGRWRWSQCSQFVNLSRNNQTQTCQHGYRYDPDSGYDSTIVTDFDLVCDRGWLGEFSMSIVCLGQSIGALVCNFLSDRYGRRPVFLACLWSYLTVGVIKAFSYNFTMFAVLTFINGFQLQGMASTCCILSIELFPVEQRTFAGVLVEFFWSAGFLSLSLIAYLIRSWRYLQLTITVPTVWTLIFYWYIPESIPWLVANGRTEEAEEIMQKAAKFNKIKIPKNIFVQSDGDVNGKTMSLEFEFECCLQGVDPLDYLEALLPVPANLEEKPSQSKPIVMGWNKQDVLQSKKHIGKIKDIFTSKALRKYTPAIVFLWFTNCLVYYGVSLTVTSLAGDRYVNVFLYALVEIPGYILVGVLLQKFGRLIPLGSSYLICGLALFATLVQIFDIGSIGVPLSITFSMLGKLAISMSFASLVIVGPEIYPTNLRSFGDGIGACAARLAAYLAPFARILDRWKGWVPRVIFAILSILAAFVVMFLPETRWRPLPETVEDVDEWRHQPKFYKPTKTEGQSVDVDS